jgi:complex III assembly factor LYRM7
MISRLGDQRLLSAARHEARKGFDSKRKLTSGGEEAAAGIAHAEDVARILQQNVVQGQRVDEEGEKYRTHRCSVWGAAPILTVRAELRIHGGTERGDNDSVKMAGIGSSKAGACCSSR